MIQLEGKYSLESTDPRESEIRAPRQLTIALKLSCYFFIIAKLFKVKDGCLKFVYIGKNPRFTAFWTVTPGVLSREYFPSSFIFSKTFGYFSVPCIG